jgi:hypothetical protein
MSGCTTPAKISISSAVGEGGWMGDGTEVIGTWRGEEHHRDDRDLVNMSSGLDLGVAHCLVDWCS